MRLPYWIEVASWYTDSLVTIVLFESNQDRQFGQAMYLSISQPDGAQVRPRGSADEGGISGLNSG